MTTVSIGLNAADPRRGLTLAELGSFVQRALREDLDPTTPVTVRVGWSGQIRRITIDERRETDA